MSALPLSRRPYLAAALVAILTVLAVLFWAVRPLQEVAEFMSETGPIEEGTAALYFLTASAWFLLAARERSSARATLAAVAVVLAAFGARELDLHSAWTGASVLKVSYYLRPAPLHHKLVALAVLVPFALCLLYLLLRHARGVWQGVRQRRPVSVTVLVFFATIILSKLVDRSENVLLEDLGIEFPLWLSVLRAAVEETLEFGLAVLPWVGWWQWRKESEPQAGR